MKRDVSPLLAPLLAVSLLFFGTGCGLLNAVKAGANPKVAWALNDPAPMTVVVRRADAAEKTAAEVDRLLAQTPVDDALLQKTAPAQDEAQKIADDLAAHPLYAESKARVVAAEVWVKTLGAISPDAKANAAALATTPAPAPAAVASAAPVEEPKKKKADRPRKKRKTKQTIAAKVEEPTIPADADPTLANAMKAAGMKPAAAKQAVVEEEVEEPEPAPEPAPAKPAAAAPPPATTAAAPAAPASTVATAKTLLGAVDPSLAEKYTAIMERRQEITSMKTLAAAEEAAMEQKGISAEDKKAHEDTKAKAEKQAEAAEAKIKPLQDELVKSVKGAAGKTPGDAREKIGPAFVNLRQALDDADIANGAAAVKYPMAVPGLLTSAKSMVPVFVADIIEEQTGKRPNMSGLQPGVSLDGGKVNVTLNGLNQSDMGKVDVGKLTTETVSRMQGWVTHVLGLLGTIGATEETLSFEKDVIDGVIEGFTGAGWKAPAAATIPAPKSSQGK